MAEIKEERKIKKSQVKVSASGRAYITSTFNNTLITITNNNGDVIGWSSAGSAGFKGTRKSTPFAATSAMEAVVRKAVVKGLKTVEAYVKGPGSGRDSALRAIKTGGLSISLIADITPIPHNGPRAKKKRRI
ncbi:MAG: 30S ribosomal protein S11 [Candidatus Levybacteria bacterium RIFCSPHIGHO2_02_FULL_37_10]|nr:MAG: 30S ribosomal protein S11 [Candidatus Levybacteria bacterium RIFCSPHIGHO2_02_FULL_37_10]